MPGQNTQNPPESEATGTHGHTPADLPVGTVLRSTRQPAAEWRLTARLDAGWQVQNCNVNWAVGFIADADIEYGLWVVSS